MGIFPDKGGWGEAVGLTAIADNYGAISTYAIKTMLRTANGGTGYGVYLVAATGSGTNWGVYQAGTENNYFGWLL